MTEAKDKGGDPRTILVYVGLDLVGDATMKLPFIHGLRQAFPQARITWLAGKGKTVFADLMAPLVADAIDEVIDDADIGSRWGELARRPLAGRSFDLIIDTQRRVLTTLILRRVRHRRFISGAAGFWLSDAAPPGRHRPKGMARQLAQLLSLAKGADVTWSGRIAVAAADADLARRLLPDGATYVGFAPGAGMEIKRWPLESYIATARAQVAAGRVPVFLLGPAEGGLVDAVRAQLPEALLPLQEIDAVTPARTIALVQRMAAAVANDCGAGHLMAAAGAPMVSLFGPTPAEKFAPAATRLMVLKAQIWGGPEMERIPVDAVRDALEGLLPA